MDSWMIAHSVLPAVGLAALAGSHIVMSRRSPKSDQVLLMKRAFGVGLIAMLALEVAIPGRWNFSRLGSIALECLTYGAFAYCYAHFVNLGATARRIRLLAELADAPEGLSEEELFNRYSAIEILGRRIARLEDNRNIRRTGGRIHTGRKGVLYMARAIVMLKMLLLGRRSEFE